MTGCNINRMQLVTAGSCLREERWHGSSAAGVSRYNGASLRCEAWELGIHKVEGNMGEAARTPKLGKKTKSAIKRHEQCITSA